MDDAAAMPAGEGVDLRLEMAGGVGDALVDDRRGVTRKIAYYSC